MSLSDSDTGNGDRASTGGRVQPKATHVSEAEARRVAEAARETEWADATFVRDVFLGNFRLELIHPYPDPDEYISERARAYIDEMREFLRTEVDSERIDRERQIPPHIVDRLRKMGAFGLNELCDNFARFRRHACAAAPGPAPTRSWPEGRPPASASLHTPRVRHPTTEQS